MVAGAVPIGVLVVLAQAADQVPLDLLGEWKVLQECLDAYGQRFALRTLPAASVDDLSRALSRFEPQVVHFSGHGAAAGLLFEDERTGSRLVPREALVRELGLHAPPLQCVILNACHSDVHAAGVRLGVPYVITMRGEIGDAAAIEFTRGFYDALAARPDDVRRAFALGCSRIDLKGLPDTDMPALHEGG